ncbi:DUF4367 domain-containing protein [Peribacillus alkalitolerans]|uniref:DUF4367 domain-containing protein n=1 Tax=Peribacillus alkalitolerans TaxID=1550385 RepID=UPI0013D85C29|nr:DUF4367 domain-containing protein [Peribacillus alkalitolerans]
MSARIIILVLVFLMPFVANVQAIKYNHRSLTIPEIKQNVNFNVFVPENIPDDWTLEIKTSPSVAKVNINSFALHYMDKNDEQMMVRIEQTKDSMKTPKNSGQDTTLVNINGSSGYLTKWKDGEVDHAGKNVVGGLLQWTQAGSYIEMYSSNIPMEKMLEIARSMEVEK